MSKVIKLTTEQLQECRRDFDTALSTMKLTDGKISFIKTITSPNEKATLYFDPLAWRKMQTLIKEFDKEVAWHGVAYRGEDETKNEYFITDILVYPQKVTGATVNTDQEKYEMWLMQHKDEVFNNIRMQGHSHVNMATSPSGVDETHQAKILEQLEDDMFYIFLIWNKSNSKFIKIYDLKKNILFETVDVNVEILDDGSGIDEFLADAKKLVEDKPTTPYYNGSGYYSGNNGYRGSYYNGQGGYSGGTVQTETKKEEPKSDDKTGGKVLSFDDVNKQIKNGSQYGKNGKRKGKRKKKENIVNPNNASSGTTQLTLFDSVDEDPFGNNDNFFPT